VPRGVYVAIGAMSFGLANKRLQPARAFGAPIRARRHGSCFLIEASCKAGAGSLCATASQHRLIDFMFSTYLSLDK
jgi:hypothetical protein